MNTLAFSLCYVQEHGFAVIPLQENQPASALIHKTFSATSTKRAGLGADEEQLRVWFSDPDVSVGFVCGEPSGDLVVIDFDDCRFPPSEYGLPLTPIVKRGRGATRGYQRYEADGAAGSERQLAGVQAR